MEEEEGMEDPHGAARAAAVSALNASQLLALRRFERLFDGWEIEAGRDCDVPKTCDDAPLQLVHGPPGCGKTVLLSAALFAAPRGASILCAAPSNAAVLSAFGAYRRYAGRGGVDASDAVLVGDAEALGARMGGVDDVSQAYAGFVAHHAAGVVGGCCAELMGLAKGGCWGEGVIIGGGGSVGDGVALVVERMREDLRCSRLGESTLRRCEEKVEVAVEMMAGGRGGVKEVCKSLEGLAAQLRAESEQVALEAVSAARVVFCTLASSGQKVVRGVAPFDALVVDEAAQAIEAEILLGCAASGARRCVLVGDPRQLPATVLSEEAARMGLEGSIMARLMDGCGVEASVLDTQHRMHPEISRLPCRLFYGGRVRDADFVEGRRVPWGGDGKDGVGRGSLFQKKRLWVVDVGCGEERRASSGSVCNAREATLVRWLVERLKREHGMAGASLAVITPYAAQAALIGHGARTVDGWQGGEADVVVVSLTRASGGKGAGFAADERRLNVALTRARHALVVLCHARTMRRAGGALREVVEDARRRGLLVSEEELRRSLN